MHFVNTTATVFSTLSPIVTTPAVTACVLLYRKTCTVLLTKRRVDSSFIREGLLRKTVMTREEERPRGD